jgi:phytoene dehydrogenase-like protein
MIEGWKWEKWSLLTTHLAIDGRPHFAAASSDPKINEAFVYVLGYETVEDLIKHWKAIENGELLEAAGLNCCFPSIHDPIQASRGRSSGLISQMAPYRLKEGMDRWYDRNFREGLVQGCLKTLERYIPGIRDQVLWTAVSTPKDIENKFPDMVQGSFKQGAYHPFQMGYNRPNSECSHHQTPIKNLYLCGASAHSGGMVTFGPGYIAANRIAEDLGMEKWWTEPEMITRARKKGLIS